MAAKDTQIESDAFTQPWDKSDVTFEVENRKLYFNRNLLALHSDVFDRMFNAEFRESDPQKEIPLPEKTFTEVQAMLIALKRSPHTPSPITEDNLLVLLQMSDEYKMFQLAVECGNYILANWQKDGTKHLRAVSLAFEYGLRSVAEIFMPLAACRHLSEIDAASESLPPEAFAAILHGHLGRLHCATSFNYVDGATLVSKCTSCHSARLHVPGFVQTLCVCTANAPLRDPKILAVLAKFGEISGTWK